MASRERRVSRPPLKYAAQDEYWDGGRRKDNRPLRQVYRLLRQKDVRKDLAGQEVHVYWPDNQQWYRATVEEVSLQKPEPTAYLHYPDTDEYEDIDLNELIDANQIAFIETRSIHAKLKRDEIPVNATDRLTAVYEDDVDGSEGDGQDDADSASSDDEGDEPKMSREHHRQVQRSKRPRDASFDGEGPHKRQVGASLGEHEDPSAAVHNQLQHLQHGSVFGGHHIPPATPAAAGGDPSAAALPPGATPAATALPPGVTPAPDSDMAEAEAFKNSIISALMHTFAGGPAAPSTMIPTPSGAMMMPTPGGSAGHHTPGPMIMIPTPGGAGGHGHHGHGHGHGHSSGGGAGAGGEAPHSARGGAPGSGRLSSLRHQASLPSAGSSGGDEEVRSKVREQLAAALQRAVEELLAEGCTEALPAPAQVAEQVEAELYKLHDNSVNKDYKAKVRSLSFNLKDSANPELRARVLRRELAPEVLVTLGPAELARKELSEWRQKRQEEAAKMVFLDAETAAKFSTAAAAALAQRRISRKDEDAADAAGGAGSRSEVSPERGADAEEGDAAEGTAGASTAAAGDAADVAGGQHHLHAYSLSSMDSAAAADVAASGMHVTSADLPRRTSVTSAGHPAPAAATLASGSDSGAAAAIPAAATAVGASPVKRTVLRAALPSVVAGGGDETPPRTDHAGEDQDGDAPYDPEAVYDNETPYDPEQMMPGDEHMDNDRENGNPDNQADAGIMNEGEEGDLPVYVPYGAAPATAAKPAGAPSVASLRGGPAAPPHHHHSHHHQHHHAAAGAPPAAGQVERQSSLSSPLRSPPAAAVADLAPVIQRQELGEGPMQELPQDAVGEPLWQGVLRVPGQPSDQVVVVEVSYLGGSGRLGPMLRCAEPPNELLVKGQVKVSRVEQFFEELRRSRSRTITLALVRPMGHDAAAAAGLAEAAAAADACGGMAEFVAQHRSRTGLATPQGALEAYLVTRGGLAARLLKTARVVCPAHQLALLPEDIGEDQLLLAMVHPRTWEPPPHALIAPAPAPHPQHHHQHHHHLEQHQHHQQPPQGHHHHQPFPQSEPSPDPSLYFPAASEPLDLSGGSAMDPRLLRAGVPPPPVAADVPPSQAAAAPAADAGAPGGLPIDLGALSDLAAALGIPGGGGGAAAAAAAAPPPALPPPMAAASPPPPAAGAATQLVTMVMQNPDGSLAIVAVPQSAAPLPQQPPPAGPVLLPPPAAGPSGGPPPPLHPHSHPSGGYPHAQQPPPHQQQQPPPLHHGTSPHPHPDHAGAPPPYMPPPGHSGSYGEPPPPMHREHHYPYGGPPGPRGGGGGPPPPYMEVPRGAPPPHHHGYPEPSEPYYAGSGGPGGPPPPHHYSHHPPHEAGGGPDGRPPPPYDYPGYPPRHEGPPHGEGPHGGMYDDPYYDPYHRGGPPPPHDPYRGGGGGPPPGRGGRGPPPGARGWGGEPGGSRRGGG
ncbi:hypothetical protein Agub_g9414, partial [Astrephomene gubernaculifera]